MAPTIAKLLMFFQKVGGIVCNDSRFLAPMAITPLNKHLFVSDFITLRDPDLGPTIAKLLMFFQKVGGIVCILQVIFCNFIRRVAHRCLLI